MSSRHQAVRHVLASSLITMLFLMPSTAIPTAFPRSSSTQKVKLTPGFYNGSAPLQERADIPLECRFEAKAAYAYWQLTGLGKPACVGRQDSAGYCGEGKWQPEELQHIKKAMEDIVAEDGFFKSAESGDWVSSFGFGTTAFASGDLTGWNQFWDSDNPDIKALMWYWTYGTDTAVVRYNSFLCP